MITGNERAVYSRAGARIWENSSEGPKVVNISEANDCKMSERPTRIGRQYATLHRIIVYYVYQHKIPISIYIISFIILFYNLRIETGYGRVTVSHRENNLQI